MLPPFLHGRLVERYDVAGMNEKSNLGLGGVCGEVKHYFVEPAGKGMLRYKDGTLTIKMNKVVLEAKELTVKAETTITENTTMKKDANVGQTLTATTDCIGGGKSLKNHTHTSAAPGSPTSPPN